MKKTTTSPATHMPEQENKTLDVDSQDFFEVAYKYRTAAPVDQDLTVKRFQELKQWIKKYGEQFQPAPTRAQEVTGVDDNRSKPAHCFAEQTGQGKENCVFPACHCGLPAQEVHKHTRGKLEVWEDYNFDKQPCFSIRGDGGNFIICKTHTNATEPPASKTAKANAARIVQCWNEFDTRDSQRKHWFNEANKLRAEVTRLKEVIKNIYADYGIGYIGNGITLETFGKKYKL